MKDNKINRYLYFFFFLNIEQQIGVLQSLLMYNKMLWSDE